MSTLVRMWKVGRSLVDRLSLPILLSAGSRLRTGIEIIRQKPECDAAGAIIVIQQSGLFAGGSGVAEEWGWGRGR